jgi:hypothetical protein
MQFHFKKIMVFVGIIIFISGLSGLAVSAQAATSAGESGSSNAITTQYTLLAPLPELNGSCPSSNSTCSRASSTITSISLSDFVSYAYKFMLALAVVLAVFMITVGGFEYMLSGAADTKNDAKKKIYDAVMGLILALVAYLLLYTIDPNLVSPSNLSIPPISYGNLTAQNGATTALQQAAQAQVQEDKAVNAARAQIASQNTTAQSDYSQADQLYNANNCAQYDSTGNADFSSDAPAGCLQAAQLYNQGDAAGVQSIQTTQQTADQQSLVSVNGALSGVTVIPCSGGPQTGINECYNGYQLNLNSNQQGEIQQQFTNITTAENNANQQVAQLNNGNQQTTTNESNNARQQIQTLIQNTITTQSAIYQQQTKQIEQGTINRSIMGP